MSISILHVGSLHVDLAMPFYRDSIDGDPALVFYKRGCWGIRSGSSPFGWAYPCFTWRRIGPLWITRFYEDAKP